MKESEEISFVRAIAGMTVKLTRTMMATQTTQTSKSDNNNNNNNNNNKKKKKKKVLLLEMSCPWMANRKQKEEEKTSKYAPLRWEIRQQYPHYKIAQYNIIIDVLGGVSRKTLDSIKELERPTDCVKPCFGLYLVEITGLWRYAVCSLSQS